MFGRLRMWFLNEDGGTTQSSPVNKRWTPGERIVRGLRVCCTFHQQNWGRHWWNSSAATLRRQRREAEIFLWIRLAAAMPATLPTRFACEVHGNLGSAQTRTRRWDGCPVRRADQRGAHFALKKDRAGYDELNLESPYAAHNPIFQRDDFRVSMGRKLKN